MPTTATPATRSNPMIEPNTTPQSRWLQAQNLARAARKVLAAARSFPIGVSKVDSAIMDLRAAFAALDHIAAAMGVDSRMERVAVRTAMSNVENALLEWAAELSTAIKEKNHG